MAKLSVGNTAIGPALFRLIEQYQPKETRLFTDPVVKYVVGIPIRIMLGFSTIRNFAIKKADATMPGLYGIQVCRTRYIDDVVLAALSQGIGQIVILGAGFDTRPYNLTGMEHVKVFEVDLPSVQEVKKNKLRKRFGPLSEKVTFIPINFDTQSLEAVLTGTAFDPSQPAIFIWEGVTQYLPEETIRRTLAFIGKSAAGSVLLFTYILKSVVERRSDITGADKIIDVMAKRNAPFIFGLEPSGIRSFLMSFHLNPTEDVGNADYQRRYFKPMGRNMIVSESERIVQATVVHPSTVEAARSIKSV
jgi:methyltransferase (TIGR00027 family)